MSALLRKSESQHPRETPARVDSNPRGNSNPPVETAFARSPLQPRLTSSNYVPTVQPSYGENNNVT